MSVTQDKENAVKAEQAASLLVSDLRDLMKTSDQSTHLSAAALHNDAVRMQSRLLALVEAIQMQGRFVEATKGASRV